MSDAISKAYNSIKELPSEVRSSFDETDQKKWMDAYNEASQNEEPEQAKVDAWMKMVDAPSSLAVETWGSVEVRDADGELVPVETIANYADKFIENGGLMHDSHSNVPVGTVWNWDVRKHPKTGQDGIVFYFNIYRDGEVFERARDDILSGRKQAVSIGAEAPRGGYKCDDRGCYVERDVTDLYELSICETPANPEAYFINVGKDIAKAKQPLAGEKMRFNVKDVVVHQDYTTCPLQKCKKVLRDKGYKNIHISDDGKVLAKSINNEYRLFKAISKLGYPFRYDLQKQQFEIIPDYGVEQAIEEALGNGWAHEDNIGHITLTKEIPKEVFLDWYDRGFIVKIGDNYCLKADDVAKGGSFENLTAESNIIWLLSNNPETRYSFEEIYAKISQSEPQISEADLKYALNELVKRPWHAGSWNIYRDGEEYFASENNLAYKKVKKDGIGKMNRGESIKTLANRILALCDDYRSEGYDYNDPEYQDFKNKVLGEVHLIETELDRAMESGYLNESTKKKVKKGNDVRKYYYSGNQTGWLNSVTFIVEKFELIEQAISNVPLNYWKLEDYESEENIGKKLSKVCSDITHFIQNTVNRFNDEMMQDGYVASSKKKVKKNDVSKGKTKIPPVRIWNPHTGEWKTVRYDEDYDKYVVYGEWEYYADESDMKESSKKKVRKEGGAMGVGDAGATNAVYGSKPPSLVTPTGDKKFGRKRKAKKEMTDDGNIHAVGSKKV